MNPGQVGPALVGSTRRGGSIRRWFRFDRAVILLAVVGWMRIGIAGAQIITEFSVPTPNSGPYAIVKGPDGALWFTELSGGGVGRATTSGTISEFPTLLLASTIATGSDGNLWLGDYAGPCVGRMTTSGVVTELGGNLQGCWGIAAGPDGNLWFTERFFAIVPGNYTEHVGRITTAGVVTEFAVLTRNSNPAAIVTGPDGALWFTEDGSYNGLPRIGRISTSGDVTEFSVPMTLSSSSVGLAAGADGNLWFIGNNFIGRMTTGGSVTLFPVSGNPRDITSGPDGALWFTQANAIGRITPEGQVTNFPMPTPESDPTGIAAGPDGAIWFTEHNNNKIGRIATTDVFQPLPVVPVPNDRNSRLILPR